MIAVAFSNASYGRYSTVQLTSDLSVHACPLVESHTRVRAYAHVHASAHTRAMRVKHVCIAKINANLSHSFSLALFSSFQLLTDLLENHAPFRVASAIAIRECTACACASTRVRMCAYSRVRARVLACACVRTRVCECAYSRAQCSYS